MRRGGHVGGVMAVMCVFPIVKFDLERRCEEYSWSTLEVELQSESIVCVRIWKLRNRKLGLRWS